MLIAVAGASGRLGRAFLLYCRQKGLPTIALLRSAAHVSRLPPEVPHLVVGYKGPGGAAAVAKALEGVTHIVNLTGNTDTSLSEDELFEANAVATKILLEATPQIIDRFVHASSIAVYGKGAPNSILDENSLKNPTDAYGRTKLEGEKIALSYANKFSVVALEPAIIYGPDFREGFFQVLKKIEEGKMQIIGDGKNHIPLVHCDDVVEAIAKALFASVPSGSTYIISNDASPTQGELFSLAASALGAGAPDKKISYKIARTALLANSFISKFSAKKPSITAEMIDQLYFDRQFSSKKAQGELGWKPAIEFKTGIEQVVNQYKKEKEEEQASPA